MHSGDLTHIAVTSHNSDVTCTAVMQGDESVSLQELDELCNLGVVAVNAQIGHILHSTWPFWGKKVVQQEDFENVQALQIDCRGKGGFIFKGDLVAAFFMK